MTRTQQAQLSAMRNPKLQQSAVDEWNALHQVGTPVEVRMDDGSLLATRTRSEAWLLGGHTAVVMIENISGGYSLNRCRATA